MQVKLIFFTLFNCLLLSAANNENPIVLKADSKDPLVCFYVDHVLNKVDNNRFLGSFLASIQKDVALLNRSLQESEKFISWLPYDEKGVTPQYKNLMKPFLLHILFFTLPDKLAWQNLQNNNDFIGNHSLLVSRLEDIKQQQKFDQVSLAFCEIKILFRKRMFELLKKIRNQPSI